ncbi:mediator complex, subunit Med18 [Pseudomassariella vexata]|uniref:Mediator of RNA polymerase II transcription subunit 18 n=1 Tax=Pseudomassariella vexata TaxID=1141098 RepID=A0A1Y2DZ06_9PEZI|nr:mediator complex, subunit Med18 [Pseudomassariella vexata]ORY64501.1 mediator complex, subunit Med18 [Pseudomassariella vexata]
MHELFLTAAVREVDFDTACAVLQGLSWMQARHNVYRVSFYAGQPQPKGLTVLKSLPKISNPQARAALQATWNELSKPLTRTSYVLQLAHEVFTDTDFSNGNVVDLNNVPGTLRWLDFPDLLRDNVRKKMETNTPGIQRARVEIPDLPITQRKRIDIPDQRNLLTIMSDNDHVYKTEMIQETYTYVRETIEFSLNRYYYLPSSSLEQSAPSPTLPPWSDLRPLDPSRKWTLHVKLNVIEDTQPEKMRKAAEELMNVKGELDQLFDFKVLDRRIFDTRIVAPPTLPIRV